MHKGSCHCGQIRYSIEGNFSDGLECNCSYCSRKGHLLWFVPRSALKLETPASAMSTYKFNKHVIDHHFCAKCGCGTFGFANSPDGQPMAAINIRCLEGVDIASVKRVPYDGRSV